MTTVTKNKYFEIYTELKQAIINNDYPPGSKLPSENVLRTHFHVSRNTIRRALELLAQEGFVTSVHGKGVFVMAKPPLHFLVDGLQSFSEASAQTREPIETAIPVFETVVADHLLASKTGFALGTTLVHLVRIRFIDGKGSILDENYFDTALIPNLTLPIAQQSIYDYIELSLKLKIHGAQKIIAIEPATVIDQRYLAVDPTQLIAVIKNNVYLDSGQQFEYTESRHLPERFVFHTFARR